MRLIGLILAAAALAAAQGIDGVNVSVSRNVNIAPDQAEFNVVAAVSLDTTQQQVLAVFQDLGVSTPVVTNTVVGANNYMTPPEGSQLYYQIYFTVAPSAVKDLSKKLDALRASLPAPFVSLQYSAVLSASQAAIDSAHQTVLPQLLSDARTRAQTLAAAAGVKLGAITGVSESFYGSPGVSNAWFAITSAVVTSSSSSPTSQYTFYVNVKFATQ